MIEISKEFTFFVNDTIAVLDKIHLEITAKGRDTKEERTPPSETRCRTLRYSGG